jgi:hypothetical protein
VLLFRFWPEVSLDFSIRSFELSWFFLQHEDCDLATEASIPRTFVKTEPLAPTLVIMISLMLVILLKTMAATQATLSNFHIEFLVCDAM